jgi:hypothetical protein
MCRLLPLALAASSPPKCARSARERMQDTATRRAASKRLLGGILVPLLWRWRWGEGAWRLLNPLLEDVDVYRTDREDGIIFC